MAFSSKSQIVTKQTLLLPEACSLAQVCSVVVVVVEEAAALEVAAQTVLAAAVAVVRVVVVVAVVVAAAVVVVVGSHLVFCYHAGLRQLDGLHLVYEEKIFK